MNINEVFQQIQNLEDNKGISIQTQQILQNYIKEPEEFNDLEDENQLNNVQSSVKNGHNGSEFINYVQSDDSSSKMKRKNTMNSLISNTINETEGY